MITIYIQYTTIHIKSTQETTCIIMNIYSTALMALHLMKTAKDEESSRRPSNYISNLSRSAGIPQMFSNRS